MSEIAVYSIIATQSAIFAAYNKNISFEFNIPDYFGNSERKTGVIDGFLQSIRHQDTNKTLLSLNILLRFIFYYHRLICRKTWEYAARYGFMYADSIYTCQDSLKPLAAVPLFFYRPQITQINTDSMFPFPLKSIADTLQAMRRLPKENNFLNFNLNLNLDLYNLGAGDRCRWGKERGVLRTFFKFSIVKWQSLIKSSAYFFLAAKTREETRIKDRLMK